MVGDSFSPSGIRFTPGEDRAKGRSCQPTRLQRKRTKGYKLPWGCVYVGRPTRFGNPYLATESNYLDRFRADLAREIGALHPTGASPYSRHFWVMAGSLRDLSGRDLACWCALPAPGEPDPCHGAILIEFANREMPCGS